MLLGQQNKNTTMFRIDSMKLVDVERGDEGLMLSWLPDGLLIEMSKQKV